MKYQMNGSHLVVKLPVSKLSNNFWASENKRFCIKMAKIPKRFMEISTKPISQHFNYILHKATSKYIV